MKTVLSEICRNDKTGIYYSDKKGPRYWSDLTTNRIWNNIPCYSFYVSPFLSFGDYDNSCHVERSNVRVFWDEFKDVNGVCKIIGGYGSESIIIRLSVFNAEVIEILERLQDYPCINDDDSSLMEIELIDECWKCCYESEFKDKLMKKFDLLDMGCNDIKLRQYFEDICERENMYWQIESGGSAYINTDKIIDCIDSLPEFITPEYYS